MIDQITISDTSPDKFTYSIGYIKAFEYLSEDIKSVFTPHPLVGAVYPLLKRDGYYILHIGNIPNKNNLKGIFLGDTLIAHVEDKWEMEIVEITKENMLDYSISSEDIHKINDWLTSDFKALKDDLVGGDSSDTIITPTSDSAIMNMMQTLSDKARAHMDMPNNLNVLRTKDPDTFEVIEAAVEYLSTDDTSLALRGLIMRSQTADCFAAATVTLIEEYMQTEDPSLLMKIIEMCTYEKNRAIYHAE